MSKKIQQFRDLPYPYAYGQYVFDSDNLEDVEPIENSTSIPKPSDRFTTKTLQTEVVGDYTRDYIIQHQLRNVGKSTIKIKKYSTFDI